MAAATQLDLTSQVKGIPPTANGGTGIAYFTAAGPTAVRTYTFPDASATVLTTNAAVTMAQGGTGIATNAADTVLQGTGAAWQTAAIPNCQDTSGSHLNYNTSTHAFSCGTTSSSGTVPNFADAEVPSGSINGSNVTFTLAHTPSPAASVECYENGVEQRAAGERRSPGARRNARRGKGKGLFDGDAGSSHHARSQVGKPTAHPQELNFHRCEKLCRLLSWLLSCAALRSGVESASLPRRKRSGMNFRNQSLDAVDYVLLLLLIVFGGLAAGPCMDPEVWIYS